MHPTITTKDSLQGLRKIQHQSPSDFPITHIHTSAGGSCPSQGLESHSWTLGIPAGASSHRSPCAATANVQQQLLSHFLLLALADRRQLQLLHFCLFLGISLAALLGNGLIISTIAWGHHLHTPMFFFLLNLALTDLGSICTTVPKAMHNSLWDTRTISYTGCAAQLFFVVFFLCYNRACPPDHHEL
ncbi:hypothetical protein DUI87_27191 [Hirundo rustica rustica]|uniref:G-protein coupled receptors family 1 profile domain-containing protein n=1 Tax=Hirundo rustica rustica TaxID=333673 RepID=A0A3M0JN87_HIRRU|nr:hypothetical protein DUI87_27191 [Hirundo rustica rustica]